MGSNHRKEFPSVSVAYSSNDSETETLVSDYIRQGYIYIYDNAINHMAVADEGCMEVNEATCREFDRVVMLIDGSFAYDENGYLRGIPEPDPENPYPNLFYPGITRVREHLALVILDAPELLNNILSILD